MQRITFTLIAVIVALTLARLRSDTITACFGEAGVQGSGRATATSFNIVESTIPAMQAAMAKGQLTSHELVSQYLIRMAMYEGKLNAALAVNPNALAEAGVLDRERAQGKVRGPLHGIPVALKDNIHTTHLPTTGGALAFAGYVPPYEATLTKNLRDAGAIIVAKTGLTELANWVAGAPNPMPGNYNGVGGFGFNPYDPRPDPRDDSDGRPVLQTGGSSSGIGTAANLWAASVGTDTGGSVISPSNANMLVGIRPTIGRISRYGVIPITADHDTAGPMTRTVADAAIMMGALESPAPDPNDAATKTCTPPAGRDYTKFLNAGALKGARIGIPRAYYYDRITLNGDTPGRPEGIGPTTGITAGRGGLNPEQARVMADAIAILKQQGAVVVDPADVPSLIEKDPKNNFASWDFCAGGDQAKGHDENCSVNFKYGMKRDFNLWLKTLGPAAPVKTLTELREWNLKHAKAGAIKYQQSRLDISDEMDVEKDRTRVDADNAKDWRLSRDMGIDGVIKANKLDAILTPGGAGAGIAARAGYPIIVVPFGMIPNRPANNPYPANFDARPAPFGIGFNGPQCSEPRLIELAYAFEQATKKSTARFGAVSVDSAHSPSRLNSATINQMKHRLLSCLAAMTIVLLWTSQGATTSVILVEQGAVWKYFDRGMNLGGAWRAIAYNDTTWSSGPAQLGYGDGDEATLVGYGPDPLNRFPTTYFRKTFTVSDPTLYQSLSLNLLRDDGAIAYLNGTKVFSTNMPPNEVGYATYASTVVGGADESTFFTASVNPALLVAGTNVLAVEVHQSNASSGDLGFDASLIGSTNLQLTRGPYLQMGTSSSVVIRWRTGGPTDSRVSYGSSPTTLTASVTNLTVTREHEVEVTGLSPFTKYYYSVGSSTQTLAGGDPSYSFVTAPVTGTAVPTRVWVLGDSGTASASAQAVRNAYYAYAGATPTNLWLMLGDNAYTQGLDTEYQAAVFDMYPTTLRQSVLWPTLGNHDGLAANSSTGTGPYYDIFTLPKQGQAGGLPSGTEAYFSFDYGDIHFIDLESYETNRAVGSPMLTWLQNDIGSTAQKWIVAFWHHPPYSLGNHDSDVDIEMREMRENVLPILEAAGVDLVLTGHNHSYERSFLIDGHYGSSTTFTSTMKKDGGSGQKQNTGAYIKPAAGAPHAGAVYAVAGSSGGVDTIVRTHPAMFASLSVLGSMVLDFANGELNASFLDSTGAIRDHFTIQKGSPSVAPSISTATLPDGVVASPYSATLTATGGAQPYTWAISAGTLPAGLSLAAASGVISGTPSGPAGTSAFDARVTGQNGLSSTRALTLRVVSPSLPGAFAKTAPGNGSRTRRSTNLTWTASAGATSYEYCYDAINNGVCDGTWRAAGTALQASLTGLAKQTTYYWQVRSRNTGGTTLADGGIWWVFVTGFDG